MGRSRSLTALRRRECLAETIHGLTQELLERESVVVVVVVVIAAVAIAVIVAGRPAVQSFDPVSSRVVRTRTKVAGAAITATTSAGAATGGALDRASIFEVDLLGSFR